MTTGGMRIVGNKIVQGKTTACGTCHGLDLMGVADVPPIAGRSPSYMVRQMWDMQQGTRNGASAQLMKLVVANLTEDDMVAIAAYVSSRVPSAAAGVWRDQHTGRPDHQSVAGSIGCPTGFRRRAGHDRHRASRASAPRWIPQEKIFAATAVGAVVIGFALQDTLGNFFAGLAIQIEKPFHVGHWVWIAETDGMVSEITWRAVKVRTKRRGTLSSCPTASWPTTSSSITQSRTPETRDRSEGRRQLRQPAQSREADDYRRAERRPPDFRRPRAPEGNSGRLSPISPVNYKIWVWTRPSSPPIYIPATASDRPVLRISPPTSKSCIRFRPKWSEGKPFGASLGTSRVTKTFFDRSRCSAHCLTRPRAAGAGRHGARPLLAAGELIVRAGRFRQLDVCRLQRAKQS